MKNIIATLILTITCAVGAENYSVVLEEFPRPVTISLPAGYQPPRTVEEKNREKSLLEYFRLNPQRRGSYEVVFLENWQKTEPMPQIVIGTLGATRGKQGKITEENWREIRNYLLQATQQEIEKVRREITPKVFRASPINEEIEKELLWFEESSAPDSAVILSHISAKREHEQPEQFSARKVMYHKGYIVFANLAVDANQPDALREIRKKLEEIRLESVE